jgi:hypothetical protein
MARQKKSADNTNGANLGFEEKLWLAAVISACRGQS